MNPNAKNGTYQFSANDLNWLNFGAKMPKGTNTVILICEIEEWEDYVVPVKAVLPYSKGELHIGDVIYLKEGHQYGYIIKAFKKCNDLELQDIALNALPFELYGDFYFLNVYEDQVYKNDAVDLELTEAWHVYKNSVCRHGIEQYYFEDCFRNYLGKFGSMQECKEYVKNSPMHKEYFEQFLNIDTELQDVVGEENGHYWIEH